MKLTTRVINAYNAFSGAQVQTVKNDIRDDPSNFLRFGNSKRPMYLDTSQVQMSDEDMYKGYPYAAIKKRANRASALGKRFLYTEGTASIMKTAKDKGEELEHPYLKLIRTSKDFTTRKFWHDISTYLDLEGVYYLLAVRAVGENPDGTAKVGEVQGFEMMNPYNVRRVIRESDGELGAYVESKNGRYREIPKEMVIEIRLLNPFDNDKAYSMTDAAKGSQFILQQAEDYTRSSIKGNVNAPGVISTDVILEDQIYENFINHIKNHAPGEPLYSNGAGGVHWESMQIDLDKAALDKINEIHRSILFAVSGTSKTALGIEESGTTRDTSQVQKDNFTEDAVMPQMEDIIDALNLDYRRWYPEWEKNEYEILLDNPLESDREAELKDIEIRETELDLREKLVDMGYEYDLANRYAHGDITLEELGEPTLEPELTPEEADRIAAQELGIEAPLPDSAIDDPNAKKIEDAKVEKADAEARRNFVSATNRFVPREENEKRLKEARVRMKARKKALAEEAKAAKKAEKEGVDESEEQSEQVIADEKKKKQLDTKDDKKTTTVTVKLSNEVPEKDVNQVSAYEMPEGFWDDVEIDPRAVKDSNYRGCIMLDTELIPVTQFVKDGDKDLLESTDRHDHTMGAVSEVEPHTTLLFGLLNNGNVWKDKVDKLLEGWSIDKVTIREVSFFDTPDSYAIVGLLEESPEILDAHGRLTLLPNVNTFSEYHPHITLAYISKDADVEKWVKALGKKYNGQIVSTKGLNYGDEPEASEDDDGEGDNSLKERAGAKNDSPEAVVEAPHSHDCAEHGFVTNSTLEKAENALDPAVRDDVLLQGANLQNAVAKLEGEIQRAVIEALRNGDIDEAERLISEAQEEGFIVQLAAIFAAYYTVMFPIYAAQLFASRLAEFGKQGVFAMTEDVRNYINTSARLAAESHVHTILKDFTKAHNKASDSAIREQLIKSVMERVQAQDPEYINRLPPNPNLEDVTKAVDKGKFDSDPIYETARNLVREGAGLNEIQRAIQEAYNHVSKVRAKTIARHEASRVFNMSQYEADLQFLKESNNLDRAYKRLRSRTGDPCAVCNLIIQETRVNPIPFEKNFADLGTELTATYRKENGKMAVQKVPISYEAIKAGNVHVNCNCEYELVIKNDDGTTLNDIRLSGEYNKFDPSQPRDKDGKWTDTGVDGDFDQAAAADFKASITDNYGKQATWTDDETEAVTAYTSTKYAAINKYLRTQGQDVETGNTVKHLDAAMKNTLNEDTELFRGISTEQEFKPGTIIVTRGYNSTSFNYNTAADFARDGAIGAKDNRVPVVMRIRAKKGQMGVIPILVNDDRPLRSVEAEFILPRNMKFKVVDINHTDTVEEVTVEVLNG